MKRHHPISTFFLLLLPVLLLAVYSFFQTRRQLINQVYEERKDLAGISAKMLHEKLDRLYEIGISFANWPTFRQCFAEPKWEHVTELMRTIPRDFPYVTNVFITDTAGNFKAGSAMDATVESEKTNFSKWYYGVSKNWQPYLSEVYKHAHQIAQTTSALAVPLKNMQGRVTGILVLEVSINKLLEWSTDINVGKSGFVYIVDQKGHIAIDPSYKNTAAIIDYSVVPAVQKALQGKKGAEVLFNPITKERRLSAYEQVPGYGWAVIVQEEAGAALSVNNSIRTVLIFYIFFVLLAIGFIWIILRSIDRQRKTALELKKSDDNIHLLVDNVKDYAILMLDTNGNITHWNHGAAYIKGYTEQEIKGKSFDVFYTAEDIGKGEPYRSLKLAEQEGRIEKEGWRKKKDGSLFWANTVITALRDENGELYGYSKITRDITERKKTQEQLELLYRQVNQSNEAIYTVDAFRRVLSWNHGAEELYGFTKEEVLGKEVMQLLQTNVTKEELDGIMEAVAEKNFLRKELHRKTKNGNDVFVHTSSSAIRDDQGNITGYMIVNVDVTERKKLMAKVNHLASIVEQSSEAIISRGIDKTLISWNQGAEMLLGYSKEEAIGKTAAELGFVKFEMEELETIENEIAEKGCWKSEKQFYHRNGSSFWGGVTANVVKNEQGQVTSVVFIIKDISLRKQLEEQLRKTNDELEQKVKERTEQIYKSEKQYRYLFENNPMPMWVMDEITFQFLDVNQRALEHYGYSRNEFLSFTALDIRPLADQKEFLEVNRDAETDIRNNNRRIWNHCKKDGTLIKVEVIAHGLNFQNKKARLILANDVTEKKQAEKKLSESERRFRTLIENNNDVITLMDESFRLIYRSPSAERVTGWTNEDMINLDATHNIHPDDLPEARAIVQQVMASPGKPVHTIFRNLHKGGHYIWMEGILTNWLHDESIKAIVFNYYDATDRIEAAAKLAASELRYRSLIENSAEGISLMSEKGDVIYRSPSGEKLLGNNNRHGVLDFAHPENLEMFRNKFATALSNPGKPINYRVRYRRADGTYFLSEGTFTNMLHIDGVNAVVANYHDVTEKVEAEEKLAASEKRFRALIEKNYDVIILFDRSLRISYRSPSATYITGRNDAETMGNTATSNIHPDDLPKLQQDLGRLLQNHGATADGLFRYRHKDGHYIWLEGTATNLLDDETVQGVIFNCRDVSKRKEAEEKLVTSEERFRTLIENNNDIINLVDESLNVVYRSPSSRRITGLTDEDILNKSIHNSVHPDETALAAAIIKETFAKPGVPIPCKIRSKHKKGHYVWLEGVVTNLLHNKYVNAVLLNLRDITERVMAEEKLAASENRFRALVEKNKDVIMLLDESFNVIYRSPSATGVNGWTDEDVKTMSALQNIHPDDVAYVNQIISTLMANPGKSFDARFRNRHKAGHYIWLEGVATNLLQHQDVNAIVFNFRDVTERIEAEEKLREQKAQLKTLGDNLNGVMIYQVVADKDGSRKFTYISNGVSRLTGRTPEEVMNDPSILYNSILEEDRETFFEAEQKANSQLSVFNQEIRCLSYKNEIRWLNIVSTPRIQQNGKIVWDGFQIDITEQKDAVEKLADSEARFRSLIENNTDAIVLNDAASTILYQSPSVSKILGYEMAERVNKKSIDYVHPESRQAFVELFEKLKITPNQPLPFQYRFLHKNGNYVWLEGVVTNLLDDPKVNAYVANYRDVTDRKEAEENIKHLNENLEIKIQQRTRQLKKTNEELEAFSYSISHDLRAPLRGIMGFTSILEEEYSSKLDDEARRLTSVIKANSLKMGNLIDDLLTFSRTGRLDIEMITINNNSIVQDIIGGVDQKQSGPAIEWVVPPLLKSYADPTTIRQVWVNLISNAVKYTSKQDVRKIELGSYTANGELVFFVKDNGVGFDNKYVNKLFKVFQRLHTTAEFEGTGVGLAIVEKIISKHGGRVWAEAVKGEGASFYFSLPDENAMHSK